MDEVKDRPTIATLLTIIRHRAVIQDSLRGIAQQLERRGELHDLSKFSDAEFPGFVRINAAARNHEFGSPEYKAALASAGGTGGAVDNHFKSNRHHPEFFSDQSEMTFIDIIEMVCDWHAAASTYGTNTLRDSLPKQRERFNLTLEQWWLVMQVAAWLESERDA